MLPVFQAAGTLEAGIAALPVPWPAHEQGDIALLFVQTANEAVTLSDAQGFVEVPDSPQGTGVAGAAGSVRLAVFWCRATSDAMAAPTVADSGNHQIARILTFRECVRTGNPYDVTAGDTGASNTAVTIPGDTTTRPDCLVLAIVADAIDLGGARFSGAANASLANLTELVDSGSTSGTGGGISVVAGSKTSAGAVNATTGTLSSASAQARMLIALVGRQAGSEPGHDGGHLTGHVSGHR